MTIYVYKKKYSARFNVFCIISHISGSKIVIVKMQVFSIYRNYYYYFFFFFFKDFKISLDIFSIE
jgi:hypothetical protein